VAAVTADAIADAGLADREAEAAVPALRLTNGDVLEERRLDLEVDDLAPLLHET
jgi:hypothetical protein